MSSLRVIIVVKFGRKVALTIKYKGKRGEIVRLGPMSWEHEIDIHMPETNNNLTFVTPLLTVG